MLIYNTLSGQKESLDKALSGSKKVRLFVCGPTVYDYPHIGNARTYIAFDIIAGYLKNRGYKVFYLQNITDIDDKIIKRAKEENTTAKAIAKKFEKIYHQNEKSLGINSVDKYARATDYIKEIIKQIRTLIQKGRAYLIENEGYYFDISAFPDYGKLSKRTTLQAEDAVSRIDESINKRNKGDFALWKFSPPKAGPPASLSLQRGEPLTEKPEPSWPSPLGTGRPGWHIEDTAISEKHFGPRYDLHGGAIDLKFPHHEAEIAQQESASGLKPFVKIWMHAGFLLVNGQKMSKSLGNFISINDMLRRYSPNVLRWIVAAHHYRSPIDYAERLASDAQKTLQNVTEFLAKLALAEKSQSGGRLKTVSLAMTQKLAGFETKFHNAMNDDFNTPEALAVIFDLINEINLKIWNLDKKTARLILKWLQEKLKIFKIIVKLPKIPLKIKRLAKKRELFRTNQQFIQADLLRKQIESLGYTIEDTPRGSLILEIKN